MHQMISVAPYSDEIMEKAKDLQLTLTLPPELDSPFFIARMLRANGDEECVRRQISDIILHRRLVGYSKMDEDAILFKMFPIVYERFSISRFTGAPKSGNVHVFVQKMSGVNLKEILTVLPLSNILHAYFALQEIFGQTIAAAERESGKPSAIVTILDLTGLNLSEFINPLSVNCKLARLIVTVWAEYFSETLVRILIVNSPGIISLMWQITKHIVDARTANRLVFLTDPAQLKDYLEPQAIPEEYGGLWRDDSGFANPPEGCSTMPLPVTADEATDVKNFWASHGITAAPAPTHISLKSRKSSDITCMADGDGHIVYQFTTSGDVLFSILSVVNGKEQVVWPSIRLASLTVPEHGALPCTQGEYILRFTSPGHTWLATKVHVSTLFVGK